MALIDVRRVMRTAHHVGHAAVGELAGFGVLATLWPAGLVRHYADPDETDRTRNLPVLLACGWGATKSTWKPIYDQLRKNGYAVRAVHFNPRKRIPVLAEQLEREAMRLMAETNSDQLIVVSHSMGGVILHYATRIGGLGKHVPLAITIGSPLKGTPAAYLSAPFDTVFGPGAAADMRPDSQVIRDLAHAPGDVHTDWVSFYSPDDEFVPDASAILPEDGSLAGPVTNVRISGAGHVGLTLDQRVIRRLQLEIDAADANTLVAA